MALRKWKVVEAKARLSQVLGEAQRGPQIIENRGREVAAVVGIEDFRRLQALEEHAAPAGRWAEFLRFSAELRKAGGAVVRLPRRTPRPSPFTDEGSG